MRNLNYLMCGMLISLIVISSCTEPEPVELPFIFVDNSVRIEGNDGTIPMIFTVRLSKVFEQDISVDYMTEDDMALAGEDYVAASGTLTIPAGERTGSVEILINGDDKYEPAETFKVLYSNPVNGELNGKTVEGEIRNDDKFVPAADGGYITPNNYPNYTLVWADEFDGPSLNTSDWNYEVGDHGWGNNELQNYQSGENNAYISNGKLVIEAKQNGTSYTSARLTTQGKQSFKYGRIDIRAKLPYGQGIWPALWMLGENFATDGWPSCGEIDIMEYLGHETNKVHGTLHWDQGGHNFHGASTTLSSGEFPDAFHVFTIIWDVTEIKWYLDDQLFHSDSITPSSMSEFHDDFFFIFNVAVGGNWPGYPDATTTFPQHMIVDYIRVFQ